MPTPSLWFHLLDLGQQMSVDYLQQPPQQNTGAHSNQWSNFQISTSLILSEKTKTYILNFLLSLPYPELYIINIIALNLETEPVQVDFIRD